ncbi:PH domain-containing protein [Parasphingorhabdus sp. DH2-15]|uniref:PH domain-containing protein n=1 Tax=Parasphingorhabdus sp. DH2-15 TaxID=3444112 RepID=UPI003F6885A4
MTDAIADHDQMAEQSTEIADPSVATHRLHPLSLVIKTIGFLPQMLFGSIAVMASVDDNMGWLVVGLALFGGFCIFVMIAWLRWRKFTYEIAPNEVRIQSGIISKNNRSIPYERIQDVNIEQKLIARILGLATVTLETGSAGNGDDGKLNAVKLTRAEELRDTIKARKRGVALPLEGQAVVQDDIAEPETEPLFTMSPKRLLILGLFSFSLAVFAFVAAIFQNLDFLIPDNLFSVEKLANVAGNIKDGPSSRGEEFKNGFKDGFQQGLSSLGIVGQILTAFGGLLGIVVIGLITGIITVFVRDYGFRLDRTENGFRRRRGLFTLTDMAMPLHRVQTAILITGPIRRIFGWYALKFQSLASDGKNESDHVVAPLARIDEASAIALEPGINIDMPAAAMQRVSRSLWLVGAVIALALTIFAASNAVFWSEIWGFSAVVLLSLPAALHLWLRWRHHHFSLTEQFLYIRSGYWSQRLTALPLRKIQSVDITDNFIQRPLDEVNLVFGIAGGSGIVPLTLHAIDRELAISMRSEMLAHIGAKKSAIAKG